MTVEGSEARERAKLLLEKLMKPNPLRGHQRVKADGTRYHRRPARFSHLPADIRPEAERILGELLHKHRDKLTGPGGWPLYGSLCAISSRMAQLRGKSISKYNPGIVRLKNQLKKQLGLIEPQPAVEPPR
jgi:hypothetical protein